MPNIAEADVICGLLRAEGIDAQSRPAGPGESGPGSGYLGWHEILVREADRERARELVAAADD